MDQCVMSIKFATVSTIVRFDVRIVPTVGQ